MINTVKLFIYVETIAMLVCNQISSNTFKNEITKLFTYKSYMYIHFTVCKQMTDAKLLMLHSNTWNHLTGLVWFGFLVHQTL